MFTKKALCIDPGTKKTGWALIEYCPSLNHVSLKASGVIVAKSKDWIERIDEIIIQFTKMFENHTYSYLSKILIEQPQIFIGSAKGQAANNSGSVMKLTALAFSIRTHFSHKSLAEIAMIPVKKWKGDQKKSITAMRVKRYWRHVDVDDNETDAIGIADWYFRKQLKMLKV